MLTTIKTMIKATEIFAAYAALVLISAALPSALGFAPSSAVTKNTMHYPHQLSSSPYSSRSGLPAVQQSLCHNNRQHTFKLYIQEEDELPEEVTIESPILLGISGLIASTIVLYSESVLFNTGCGLPAGAF